MVVTLIIKFPKHAIKTFLSLCNTKGYMANTFNFGTGTSIKEHKLFLVFRRSSRHPSLKAKYL